MLALVEKLVVWGNLIKFSHSVFALPFAVIMILAVARVRVVTWGQISLLLICVVAARSAAMAFNRLVDARFDARNARTRGREIPAGKVSSLEAVALVVGASTIFVLAAFSLGDHCGVLSFPVLCVLLGYSFVKRFSSVCHLVLGLSLAMAPGGVWYALTAEWSARPAPLMLSVLLWVAGFDILYACQDLEFDRENGLFSVPSKFGISRSLKIAALMHICSVVALFWFGWLFGLGILFWIGAVLFSLLIASQHITVFRRGLDQIDQVFFLRNGAGSLVLMVFGFFDWWVR